MPVMSPSANPAVLPLRAKFFHGLADPSRLALLEALRPSAQTVGELVNLTGLSQPNTSTHLSCLLECGLVQRERQGRYMLYSLADARVATLLSLVDELLATHHEQLAACTRYGFKEESE